MNEAARAGLMRWLRRLTDDIWGAAQLLGLFFLGATILCVPPKFYVNPAPAHAPEAFETAEASPPESGMAKRHPQHAGSAASGSLKPASQRRSAALAPARPASLSLNDQPSDAPHPQR